MKNLKKQEFLQEEGHISGEYLSPRDCVRVKQDRFSSMFFSCFSVVLTAKSCEEDREKRSIATEKAPGVHADIKGLWPVWVRRFSSLCRLFNNAAQGSHYDECNRFGHIVGIAVCQGKGTNIEGVTPLNLNGTDIVEYKVVEIPVICKNCRISMTISIFL